VRMLTAALAVIVAVLAFTAGVAVAEAKPSKTTVIAVQKKLGVPADGVVGPQTRRAVRRFQRRNGLIVDGVIGPQTLRALGIRARRASVDDPEALLAKIAECESGGDPKAVSPDGRYRGKYQFSRETWRSLGGEGDPADAPEAEQDRLARLLLERQGPSAWPSCA
jgi:lysozyme family protein